MKSVWLMIFLAIIGIAHAQQGLYIREGFESDCTDYASVARYDLRTGKKLKVYTMPGGVGTYAVNAQDNLLAVAITKIEVGFNGRSCPQSTAPTLAIFSTTTGRQMAATSDFFPTALYFRDHNSLLASGAFGLVVLDLATLQLRETISAVPIITMTASLGLKEIAIGTGGYIEILDINTFSTKAKYSLSTACGNTQSLTFDENGAEFYGVCEDSVVGAFVIQRANGAIKYTEVSSRSVFPSGDYIYAGQDNQLVALDKNLVAKKKVVLNQLPAFVHKVNGQSFLLVIGYENIQAIDEKHSPFCFQPA